MGCDVMVWCGMVPDGMGSDGVVWCGMAWPGTGSDGVARHGMVLDVTVWHGMFATASCAIAVSTGSAMC